MSDTPEYAAAIHSEAAYDDHAAGLPHDTQACGQAHRETIITNRGETPVYHAGTLAYIDSFAGMVPCIVTAVTVPGTGYQAAPASGEITVRITATRGGYKRGEVLTYGAHEVVPRAQHYYRGGYGRINNLYAWA